MAQNYLTIDIGGTYIKHALVNEKFELSQRRKIKTPRDKESLINAIIGITSEQENLDGVSICCPGKVTTDGVIYYGGMLTFMHETPLAQIVSEKLAIPCTVINDGKAAALAEHAMGNLKGISNGIAMILGSGVGGGLIINNQLFMGHNSQAGEFSFMIKDEFAKPLLKNTVGAELSAVNFVQSCAKILGLEDLDDGQKVFEEIAKGENTVLLEIYRKYCRKVAALILNLQAVYDNEKLVIGGGVSAQDILVDEILTQYHNILDEMEIIGKMIKPLKIERCAFSNDANLLGAYAYYYTKCDK